jgi:hypothetical protein
MCAIVAYDHHRAKHQIAAANLLADHLKAS